MEITEMNYKTLAELGLNPPFAFYNINQLDSYAVFEKQEKTMEIAQSRAFVEDNKTIMKFKKPVTRKIQKDESGEYVTLNKQKYHLVGFKTF
jgi:hypothetical protein